MGFQWDQLMSFSEAENDSYNSLELDDAALEELYEELEWYKDEYVRRIENQIKLVEHLRSQGYRGSILVYISW